MLETMGKVKLSLVVRRRGSHIFYTVGSQMAVRLSALRPGSYIEQ
jgi:hypothetical protein